jgi:hypothetical protein
MWTRWVVLVVRNLAVKRWGSLQTQPQTHVQWSALPFRVVIGCRHLLSGKTENSEHRYMIFPSLLPSTLWWNAGHSESPEICRQTAWFSQFSMTSTELSALFSPPTMWHIQGIPKALILSVPGYTNSGAWVCGNMPGPQTTSWLAVVSSTKKGNS